MGNCVGSKGKKDPKILTDEEIKLLMDNTRLTKPQILALHRNFLKECPKGKLNKKDFVKLFKEVHPSESKKEKADKFCVYVFKVIDRENLGYISFQEFVLCFILTSDGEFKEKCDFAFRLYDLDKDNKISKKEMTQVLTALYDLSGITNRKGDAAPKAKVEEIIKAINLKNPQPAKEEKKPSKPAKAGKKAKPVKGPDFITKEQFVDACNNDEQIKQLFVDSIFCGGDDSGLKFSEPAISVEGGQLNLNAPSLEIHSRSLVEAGDFKIEAPQLEANVELPTADLSVEAPAVEVSADNSAEIKIEAPSLEVSAEAPALDVNVEAPAVEISADAPAVEVSAEAPALEVNVEAPKVEVAAE